MKELDACALTPEIRYTQSLKQSDSGVQHLLFLH